jgi:hypothetical protein
MKRRTFLVSVDGQPCGHAFAYNSALRKGEAAIRAALPPGGSATYTGGHLDLETMRGWKEYRLNTGEVRRVEVAPEVAP